MTPPTLPGDLPGLLRRGSPILAVWDESSEHADISGVVLRVYESGTVVPCANCGWDNGDPDQSCALATLHLDLSDATGRAHAAWWLAESGAMLPIDAARRSLWVHEAGERQWTLWAPLDDCAEVYGPYEDDASRRVPAFAHLDPDDNTRLPDGSRWVDAEALRIVCLHVAGRPA